MKRVFMGFIAILFLLPLLSVRVNATLEYAIEEMEEILPDGITEAGLGERLGVEATLECVMHALAGEMPGAVRFFLLMLAVGVLYTLAAVMLAETGETGASVRSGVQIILAVCICNALLPLVKDAVETVSSLSRFCTLALPIFVGVHAAMGAGESAMATAAGLGGLLSLFEWGMASAFLPLFSLHFGVSLLGTVEGGGAVSRLGTRLYRFFLLLMGFFTVVVSGVMSLQSALASAKDSLLLRTVRHATGTMIPVVGATVSGTLSTLLAGGVYVRETVGTLALLGLLTISLPLLVRLLLYRAALGALTLLPLASEGELPLFETVRRALDLLLALLSMSVVLFLLSAVLFLRSGGGNFA